jgi:DNA-binding SARP family transcriptional activator/tetratricopeptide (TPR) repeat protein
VTYGEAVEPGLKVELLGPMRVFADGRQVVVTGDRQRTLLAVLAMSAGERVSVERLATAMWDSDLPADPRNAVQLYVARLRAELGAEMISTKQAGYVLHAGPDQVDALRLTQLLDKAAQNVAAQNVAAQNTAADDVTAERQLLTEALALWRGTPFEDVGSVWLVTAVAPRLVERYLAGIERRIDLDLADGHDLDLVADLVELTSRHPLRESLWVRRLVVLARSGRHAEALASYDVIRSLLADELGTDPGPELQAVHADLLAGRTPASPDDRTVPRRLVPRQLPADIGGFTGRAADLLWLEARLDRGQDPTRRSVQICAIAGAAGIGKSALAIHTAHGSADRFTDGQLYVDLQGATAGLQPLAPLEVLGRFLRALGVGAAAVPTEPDEAGGLFRSLAADRRLLVVLDNAANAAQVNPLLPAGPGCGVLVTSRAVLTGIEGAQHLRLDALASTEAIELLGRLAGVERVAAEPQAAADVIRWCASLPLAVRIAGARLATRPSWLVDTMAERLADAGRRLDELEIGEAGARASFAVSTEQASNSTDPLDRAAARSFGLLGLFDGPELGVPVAAKLLNESDAAAERVLERLVDIQLLETQAPGRYRLHDLLRLYARELAEQEPAQVRTAALTRVLTFYLATAWQTLRLLRPGDYRLARTSGRTGGLEFADDQAALEWLDTERVNLAAVVQQAAASGSPDAKELAVHLAHTLYGYFLVRGDFSDWMQVNQAALGMAQERGDLAGQAQVHNDLGVRSWRLARYDEALASLADSLTIRRTLGDLPGQAATLVNLGLIHQWQRRYDEALACHQESLAISRSIDDPRGAAGGLANLGDIYQRQDRYEDALAALQESLTISRELGDRRVQATALNNLGALYSRQERYDLALTAQEDALAIFGELGDRDGEAFCLTDIAVVQRRQGHHEDALTRLRDSLAIRRQLGDLHGQAETLRELGATLHELGRIDEARDRWKHALVLFEQVSTADAEQVHTLLAGCAPGGSGRGPNPQSPIGQSVAPTGPVP